MSYLALAIGRVPGLFIDRAGIALVGASLMVASGAITLPTAYQAIDINTIKLLLGMMIVVANLRLSGFFALRLPGAARVHRPIALLRGIVVVAGLSSAFLVNDAVCLVLAPLVLDLTLPLRRNPVPYLLAVAMASNIGSAATMTGNPRNMLIAATAAVIVLFFAGQPPAKAAIVVGALLLLTRRVKSTRIYAEIDWSLLLMFAGLFVITAGAGQALLTPDVLATVALLHLDKLPVLGAITAVLSNMVCNVPAVLFIRPISLRCQTPRGPG